MAEAGDPGQDHDAVDEDAHNDDVWTILSKGPGGDDDGHLVIHNMIFMPVVVVLAAGQMLAVFLGLGAVLRRASSMEQPSAEELHEARLLHLVVVWVALDQK